MEKSNNKIIKSVQGVILLPQTAMRVWGMNLPPSFFFQVDYRIKFKKDNEITQAIYEMNKLLLMHDNHNVSRVYRNDENIPFSSQHKIILDCQVVNLIHYYSNLNKMKNLNIIDYSSLGHRYVAMRDLVNINQFVRAVLKSFKFWKKHSIKTIWHWRMKWEVSGFPLTFLFWENKFLDNDSMQLKSLSFVKNKLHLFPEFKGLSYDSQVLLIIPHTNSNFPQLLSELCDLLDKDLNALQVFNQSQRVVVKQHRVAQDNYPNEFKFRGKVIIVATNPLTKVLPVEVLLLGMRNISVLSTISSALFAASDRNCWALGKITHKDRKDYGFMLKKASRDWREFEFDIHKHKE